MREPGESIQSVRKNEVVVVESDVAMPTPKYSSAMRRSINRLLLTSAFLTIALTACQTTAQPEQPSAAQPESSPQPTAWITLTPFQPSPPTETATPMPIQEQPQLIPVVEALLPEFQQPTAIPEIIEIDPLFIDQNSYVLKNPTEIIQSPEHAEYVVNTVLQRLRSLGLVQDAGAPITVSFNGTPDASLCRANSASRHIECENDQRQYLRPDVSLLIHELLHIVENDSPTGNIGELRAVMGAFILSGRNPQIHDRYLFATGFEVNGAPVVFSASDIVYGLEAQGISEHEMLNFVFNYNANWPRITQGSVQWMNTVADFSQNSEYIIARTHMDGYGFLSALSEHLWAINPYNSLLTPDTSVDYCRANIMSTPELLALDNRQCVINK
jgi:hypothetical protein